MSNFEKQFSKALAIRREILHEIKEGKASRRAMLKKLLYTSGALAVLYHWRGAGADGNSGPGGGEVAGGGEILGGVVKRPELMTMTSSPHTPPFVEGLPVPPRAEPKELTPAPQEKANVHAGEAPRSDHQAFPLLSPPFKKTYELKVREAEHSFHPHLPKATIWGFDGRFPGPTFHARYNEPIAVRIHNELQSLNPHTDGTVCPHKHNEHTGFGHPEISTHLHNLHVGSESDGSPEDFYPARNRKYEYCDEDLHNGRGTIVGTWKDFHWGNKYAGFNSTHKPDGDPREGLGTLWYHDHRAHFTSHNVYKGMAGFYLLFDELDSGDETDTGPGLPLPNGDLLPPLRLPSGEFDVPVVLADKLFHPETGELLFDQFDIDGLIGQKVTVNGKILPFVRVKRRRYRFRVLNAGPARVYHLDLLGPTSDRTGRQLGEPWNQLRFIAKSGNLAEQTVLVTQDPTHPRLLGVAMRRDVIVDFRDAPPGSHFYLVDRLVMTNGRKPDGLVRLMNDGPQFSLADPGEVLARVDVEDGPPPDDPSTPLEVLDQRVLRPAPDLPFDKKTLSEDDILRGVRPPGVEQIRTWRFDRSNGVWTINNKHYDPFEPGAEIAKDTNEIWVLENTSNGWVHPIHIHLETFHVLFTGGFRPLERGQEIIRRDTTFLGPGQRVVLFMRFRDFTGRYVMHCHNVMHEDHEMMVAWDVV